MSYHDRCDLEKWQMPENTATEWRKHVAEVKSNHDAKTNNTEEQEDAA